MGGFSPPLPAFITNIIIRKINEKKGKKCHDWFYFISFFVCENNKNKLLEICLTCYW